MVINGKKSPFIIKNELFIYNGGVGWKQLLKGKRQI